MKFRRLSFVALCALVALMPVGSVMADSPVTQTTAWPVLPIEFVTFPDCTQTGNELHCGTLETAYGIGSDDPRLVSRVHWKTIRDNYNLQTGADTYGWVWWFERGGTVIWEGTGIALPFAFTPKGIGRMMAVGTGVGRGPYEGMRIQFKPVSQADGSVIFEVRIYEK